jgi:hypothetical protein
MVHRHVSSNSICANEKLGDDKGEVAKRASEEPRVKWRHGVQHPISVRQVPSLPHLDPRAIPNPFSLAFSYQSCFSTIDLAIRTRPLIRPNHNVYSRPPPFDARLQGTPPSLCGAAVCNLQHGRILAEQNCANREEHSACRQTLLLVFRHRPLLTTS